MSKMIWWDVYKPPRRGGKPYCFDSVSFDSNCDKEYVRKSLIEHDGYPDNIIVKKHIRGKL